MTANVNSEVNEHFLSAETKQVRSTIKLFGFIFLFEIEFITLLETKTKHTGKRKVCKHFVVKEENFMGGVSSGHAPVDSIKQGGQE